MIAGEESDCSVACQRWSQGKLTLCQPRVDDLNQSLGQLGLCRVSLHLINVHRLLSDTLTWKKTLVPHAGIVGILDVLYFCLIQQAGAGWLQARRVRPVPQTQVGRCRAQIAIRKPVAARKTKLTQDLDQACL